MQSILRNEVPEVMRSEVHVHAISRIPGQGTMVVVGSDSPHVDPVAAVIGEQGSRIQQIVQALDGERVTVVPWSERPEELVAEAVGIRLEDHFVAEGARRVVLVPCDEHALGDVPYRSHTSWLDDPDMTVFQLAADVSGHSISIVRAPEYAAHGREAAAFKELRPRTANESVLSALLHRDGYADVEVAAEVVHRAPPSSSTEMLRVGPGLQPPAPIRTSSDGFSADLVFGQETKQVAVPWGAVVRILAADGRVFSSRKPG